MKLLRSLPWLAPALLSLGCSTSSPTEPPSDPALPPPPPPRSGSIAITPDGAQVVVVNQDADSLSILDARARALLREIPLGPRPSIDPTTGRYEPGVEPRAVALDATGQLAYVTGRRSGMLYRVHLGSGQVDPLVTLGSEPTSLVLSRDGRAAFVTVCGEGEVARVNLASSVVERSAHVGARPWAIARSEDGASLFVTLLLGPGVVSLDPETLATQASLEVPDEPPRDDPRLYNGAARALYDLVERPGTGELWIPHTLSSTTTAQPRLDFETSVFPAVSILSRQGALSSRLSTDAAGVPGTDGALADVVSGPRAIALTPDGRFALVLDQASEDVLVIDAERRTQAGLLRPLPGDMPEGIAISPDGTWAAIDERNSADVAFLDLSPSADRLSLAVAGPAVKRLAADPMPPALRLGQRLFFSANSDELPVTRNHWVACASCHIEGRSDAVTWRFLPGPRKTPSNAGGTRGTGLLLRSASRVGVRDYFRTFAVEQGGSFEEGDPRLDALASFVDLAIPLPTPPRSAPAAVSRGRQLFFDPQVGCASCHGGPAYTDSSELPSVGGLAGELLLHDVGTCATGPFPDVTSEADDGSPRPACAFDTPTLRGLADAAPYLHDGSAPTLEDALARTRGRMGHVEQLSPDQIASLVAFLRSL